MAQQFEQGPAPSQAEFDELNSKKIDGKIYVENNQSSSSVSALVDALISLMTSDGIYSFAGSWTQHSNGYSALCSRQEYNSIAYSYFGTIKDHSGNVWVFTYRTNSSVNIKQIATA